MIATRHAGIPDVVLDGRTGLLGDEGDVESMADAMVKLLRDPALAQRLGAAGRERVLQGFTVDHHLRDLTGLLLRIRATAGAMR